MKRQKRLTKADRQERATTINLDFLAEALNPAGIFGDVDLQTLVQRLTPAEVHRRVLSAVRAKGGDWAEASFAAHLAVCQLANGACTHTDQELAELLPMVPAEATL